jgi:hypothetical protein
MTIQDIFAQNSSSRLLHGTPASPTLSFQIVTQDRSMTDAVSHLTASFP